MAEATDTSYLSIGEVLGLLLEEFPDITISKIRFLESQGLISPERTSSGYRKFYDDDVDLLRVILTEQRQNYLPLRVIKDRLQTGQIDPTGEHLRSPGEDGSVEEVVPDAADRDAAEHVDDVDEPDDVSAEVPSASISSHPAARTQSAGPPSDNGRSDAGTPPGPSPHPSEEPLDALARLLPGVLLDRGELCSMVGMTDAELTQLESFGVVAPRDGTGTQLYDDDAVEIARPACEFLRAGIDARHLRSWRTSAEREASLYEQIVTPRYRQRNPEARAEALAQLRRLDELGDNLRAAMMRHALRHHFES